MEESGAECERGIAIHGSKSNPKKLLLLLVVMRPRDLHPLCCLPADDGGSPPPTPPLAPPPPSVAGLLYKWTNIGKGWRPRWFAIRGDVLTYSKIPRRSSASAAAATRIIGPAQYGQDRPVGLVHLKVRPALASLVCYRMVMGFNGTEIALQTSIQQKSQCQWEWDGLQKIKLCCPNNSIACQQLAYSASKMMQAACEAKNYIPGYAFPSMNKTSLFIRPSQSEGSCLQVPVVPLHNVIAFVN